MANIRSAYAECTTAVLTEDDAADVTYNKTDKSATKEVTLTQEKKGWIGDNGKDVAGQNIQSTTAQAASPKGTVVTVTVKADGSVEIKDKAKA